ncbi:hypothetical protein D3C71_1378730 [compost metagenome]
MQRIDGLAQPVDVGIAGQAREFMRGKAFQQRAQGIQVVRRLFSDAHHRGATMGLDGYQPFGLQGAQGLAQRAAADAQLFTELHFAQAFTALDVAIHDGAAQIFLDAGAQGGGLFENRTGGGGHGCLSLSVAAGARRHPGFWPGRRAPPIQRKDAIYPADGSSH